MEESAFRLAQPWLLALALPALWLLWRAPRAVAAPHSAFVLLRQALTPSRGPQLHRWLVAAALICMAVALARPQWGQTLSVRTAEGRNLMLLLDLSGSMRIDDMRSQDGTRQDRFATVMQAAADFIQRRPNDRLGLVVFAEQALTSCPLTYDHATLREFLKRLEQQQRLLWEHEQPLVGDGTNIGLGLGTALRRLQNAPQAGRAVILITDGADTRKLRNWVDPLTAADYAQTLGVRVYCIGVGDAQGTMTVKNPFSGALEERRLGREQLPDLARLEHIAKRASGQALAANNPEELTRVMQAIDQLETSPSTMTTREDYADRFHWPLLLGLCLLGAAALSEPRLRGPLP